MKAIHVIVHVKYYTHVFCVYFACKSAILHTIFVRVNAAIPVACTVWRGSNFCPVNCDSSDKNTTISYVLEVNTKHFARQCCNAKSYKIISTLFCSFIKLKLNINLILPLVKDKWLQWEETTDLIPLKAALALEYCLSHSF